MRHAVAFFGCVLIVSCLHGCGGGTGTSGYLPSAAKSSGGSPAPASDFSYELRSTPASAEPLAERSAAAPTAAPERESLRAEPSIEPAIREPADGRRSTDARRRETDRIERAARRVQSGTLTAGSFDDNERFEDYRRFLSLAMQQDSRETLMRRAVHDRAIISVKNENAEPIGDARVVIRAATDRQRQTLDSFPVDQVLLESTTGTDGRILFLPSLAGGAEVHQFSATVYPPGSGTPVSQVFRREDAPWQITLRQTPTRLPTRLDLALVIDTTGSMGDELEYLKAEIDSIAGEVHRLFPNVDQRYALVVYRDQGDQYVTRTFDFTGSLDDFRDTLSQQFASGGGDYPEAVHLALEQAARLSWRDRDTARVMFLVGDAPPHDEHLRRSLDGMLNLKSKGIRVFPVAASGADLKCEFVMRAAAFLTLSQYCFLTDHSGVGNPHAEPHVPSYNVEHLNRLMIRMIASELAGKRLLPSDIIDRGGEQAQRFQSASVAAPHHPAPPPRVRTPVAVTYPPRWVILAVAIVCWFVVEAVIERNRGRCLPAESHARVEV